MRLDGICHPRSRAAGRALLPRVDARPRVPRFRLLRYYDVKATGGVHQLDTEFSMATLVARTQGPTTHFSGHETFPLRQMWLKKAYDHATDGGLIPKASRPVMTRLSPRAMRPRVASPTGFFALSVSMMSR